MRQESKNSNKKSYSTIIGVACFAITIFIAGAYFLRCIDWKVVSQIRINPYWLALALIIQAIYVFVYSCLWHLITRMQGIAISFEKAHVIWLFGNIGKYLPLRVLHFGYRMFAYYKAGRKVMDIAYSNVLEAVTCTAGALLASFLLMFLTGEYSLISQEWTILLGSVFLAILLLSIFPFFRRSLNWILNKISKGKIISLPTLSASQVFILVLSYSILWVVLGGVLYCLGMSIYPHLGFQDLIRLTIVYSIAGLVGMAAVFAPSGLGVREGVLLFGLTHFMPPTTAAVLTVLARLVGTAIEWLGIFYGFVRLEASKKAG